MVLTILSCTDWLFLYQFQRIFYFIRSINKFICPSVNELELCQLCATPFIFLFGSGDSTFFFSARDGNQVARKASAMSTFRALKQLILLVRK